VESSSNIEVVCEVESKGSGGTPILWVIEEGAYVKEGDKLVELDSSALENEVKSQRILVSSAEATAISSSAAVQTATIALKEYLEGTYLSERKTLLSEVALAQQELRKAELNLASAERLAAKGVIKGLQIEAEEFAVVNAQNILEAAEARLKVLDELTKEKNKVQFESDIEAAKAKLRSDESVLAEEQEKLRDIEDQIAKCVVYSPAEGVVVYNNKFSSRGGAEFVVEEGAMVRERQTIIKLPNPNEMQVKADVNESRITLIADGMPAKVKVSAVPGEMLAKVKRVNKYAEPGSWFSSSVKEYATYIEIINPPPTIRTGMTAEVRIYVEQLPNALQIPVHGVYEYKGLHFCLRKEGEDKWETVEITIGATNDKMVTIDEGLQEGDVVALNPRQHLDLMQFPEVEEVTDRDKLKEIGADAATPAAAEFGEGGRVQDGPGSGAGRGPGGPGGGPGGPGGPGDAGGFNPQAMVDRMFSRSDTNGDGKISKDELGGIDANFRDRVSAMDANGDGDIERSEVMKAMRNFSGGGGRPGGR
jgi:multidrug efflux pump subunit AcrA (membrane-fusion protein)